MRPIVLLPLAALAAAACSSVDCPVENVVALKCELLKADGSADTLRYDTLTITTTRRDGNDTTLLNRQAAATAFSLPISSGAAADTLFIELRDTLGSTTTATVYIGKTDEPHFESVDCTMSHFHTLTSVTTEGEALDSVAIHKSHVDYDTSTTHLHFYFAPRP